VLAPLRWDADGWPVLEVIDNNWGVSYPYPLPPHPLATLTGTDQFRGSRLDAQWEWNHNPDNKKWRAGHGLTLETATVTDDLYKARNTLTHRILGPTSSATIVLDDSAMKDGDRAGLAMLRDSSAWVGVAREQGKLRIVMEDNITMDRKWQTTSTGTEVASMPVRAGRIWLRVSADILPGSGRTATFSWSADGPHFHPIGSPFVLDTDWHFFMGYRYAIFNFATKALGGRVKISSFTMTKR
jgi:beta-xylosidase